MVQPQRVDQANAAQLFKRLAFAVRTHDCAPPQIRVVNILVFRRNIEVAANDERLLAAFPLQAIPQARVPL
jgi:hypothetical protein